MFDAQTVYGAGPIAGGPNGAPAAGSRMTGAGKSPSPNAEVLTTETFDALSGGLTRDPTFWLVAMVGAAAYLAIWSS